MKIRLNGPVIDDGDSWIYRIFGIDAIYPKFVNRQIEQAEKNNEKELTVLINSGGGSVFAASEIYTALRSFKGTVHTQIVGIAASAASFIANAGRTSISPTGQIMIHNASAFNVGDHRSMDKTGEILRGVNASIRSAYKAKTGMSDEELTKLMEEETWLTAERAVEMGFADEIMFEDETADLGIIASDNNGALPRVVIDKMKSLRAEGKFLPTNQKEDGDDYSAADEKGQMKEILSQMGMSAEDLANMLSGSMQNKAENSKGKEVVKMDLETLKNEHPELYKSIKDEGYAEGAKAENDRIKEIEDLAYPGVENLVRAAKFENNGTAADLAIQIVKAEKAAGSKYLAERQEDAGKAGTVPAAPVNENDDSEAQAKNVSALVAAMGGGKQ